MNNLLYKEFKLTISPFYFVLPALLGALILIPQWLFFLVPLYFCFITVPNLFAAYKAQNDLSFSVMMPVSKSNIVKAKLLSIMTLELVHVIFAAIFAVLNKVLYNTENLFFNPNVAFIGLIFVMFGIFNLVLFPMFYKTGYKYGAAVIVSTISAFLFVAAMELSVVFNKKAAVFFETDVNRQLAILALGLIMFLAMSYIAYKISLKRFKKVDV